MRQLTLFFLLLIFFSSPVHGAPQIRPQTGIGLLVMRSLPRETLPRQPLLVLFESPGVHRVAETTMGKIPHLDSIIGVPPGEYAIAVLGKKGNWLRISYDDAGREGWLKRDRSWEYTPWDRILTGSSAALLPKLGKARYLLLNGPGETFELLATLPARQQLRVIQVDGDWLKVTEEDIRIGWLRWRDAEGRFLISIDRGKP